MAADQLRTVLRHIRRLIGPQGGEGVSDAQLLERFLRERDETAFEVLVWRHGPMVLGLCQRLLRNVHAAEDALQATFLTLVRKGSSISKRESVGSWLYKVAYRIALRAKASAAEQAAAEKRLVLQASARSSAEPSHEAAKRELQQLLDDELNRLPEKYRVPIVLCYLEDKTFAEAAQELGWAKGTVSTRMTRGRELLRTRLARRGVELSAGAIVTVLAQSSAPALPGNLVTVTVKAALAFAAGQGAATGVISAEVAALTQGALQAMFASKLKVAAGVLVAIGSIAAGAGLLAFQELAKKPAEVEKQSEPQSVASAPAQTKTAALNQTGTEQYGDPLPAGAMVRVGTLRFRHGHVVSAVAFSPDGKILASGSWDKTVRFWEPTTGKQLRVLTEYDQSSVTSVAFTPDGKTLASGCDDGTVRLWDVPQGTLVRTLSGQQGRVTAVAFSPDGKDLASAGADQTVHVWEISTGKELTVFRSHGGGVWSVAFAPDGKTIVSGAADGTVRWWEAATGKELRSVPIGNPVFAIAISPDGKLVASGSDDRLIRLWDFASGKELHRLQGHRFPVQSLCFAANGKSLASGAARMYGGDCDIKLWDAQQAKPLRSYGGHHGEVFAIALSPDGKTLASAGSDNTLRVWDTATGKELGPQAGHRAQVVAVAFTADGKMVASASDDQTIRFWDAASRKELRRFKGHAGMVQALAFAPDSKTLASAGREGTVRLWDVATARQLRCWRQPVWFHSVGFSPDGKLVAAGSSDPANPWIRPGAVWVWDRQTGAERWHQEGQQAGARCVGFSADGRLLASGSNDRTIALWRVAAGTQIQQLVEPQGEVESLAFSPDGRLLAAGGRDHKVYLWDAATSKLVRQIEIPGDFYAWIACAMSFSPDGKTLAVGSWKILHLYEVATGKQRRVFTGHQGDVRSVAFAPDGRTLVSASGDATMVFWDLTGGAGKRPEQGTSLSAAELQRAWTALGGNDAASAYEAIWTLAAVPGQSLPLLRKSLQPVAPVETAYLANLLADLDNDAFAIREKASRELERLGDRVEPALRLALQHRPSPEVRVRIDGLLIKLRGATLRPEQVRALRGLEVVEQMNTPEARQLLATLAKGVPEARLTQEAKASLDRLRKRPAIKP